MSAIIRVETCILKGGFSYNGNVPIPPYNKLNLTDSGVFYITIPQISPVINDIFEGTVNFTKAYIITGYRPFVKNLKTYPSSDEEDENAFNYFYNSLLDLGYYATKEDEAINVKVYRFSIPLNDNDVFTLEFKDLQSAEDFKSFLLKEIDDFYLNYKNYVSINVLGSKPKIIDLN